MAYRFEFRRDTAANWTLANPVLASGEPGVETDTLHFKIGDGVTAWAGLGYISGTAAVTAVNGKTGAVSLSASDVGADAAGAASAAVAALPAVAHTGSYADLSGKPTIPAAVTVAAAGTAGAALSATDATTTNSRTPLAHAASHATGGSDAVTPAAIGADASGAAASAQAYAIQRANHTGTQPASTVTGLDAAVAGAVTPGGSATAAAIAADPALRAAYVARVKSSVTALGTSITAGSGAAPGNAWVTRLPGEYATAQPNGPTIAVVNAGVSGDTEAQMLARLPALLAQSPTTVLIETSPNDARADLSITSDTTITNLRKIVGLCRMYGARPIVATAGPISPGQWIRTQNGGSESGSAYTYASAVKAIATNVQVRSACSALAVDLVDIEVGFGGRVLHLADGVHPDDTGHLAWADAFANVLAGLPVGQLAFTGTPATLLTDTFDRANSTTTIGGTWDAPVQGTWGISGNLGYSVTGANDDRALISVGQSDQNVSVVGSNVTAGQPYNFGVIARASSGSSYLLGDLTVNGDGTGSCNLYRYQGFYSLLRSATLVGLTASTTLGVRIVGTSLQLLVNGIVAIDLTETVITTGNKAGLRLANGGALVGTNVRFDNFTALAG